MLVREGREGSRVVVGRERGSEAERSALQLLFASTLGERKKGRGEKLASLARGDGDGAVEPGTYCLFDIARDKRKRERDRYEREGTARERGKELVPPKERRERVTAAKEACVAGLCEGVCC